MPISREKLRLRPDARSELLATERVAHCATVSEEGEPHVAPLWFVHHSGTIWVNSLRRSRRAADLASGSRVSVCIDGGVEYGELRGVTLQGRFEEAEPPAEVKEIYGRKYWHGADIPELKSHVWLRLNVSREVSWDFRRISEAGEDRRLDALRDQGSEHPSS